MAKTVDSWTNADGTGAIVTEEDGETITSHFIPESGYPKGEGPVRVSMSKAAEKKDEPQS